MRFFIIALFLHLVVFSFVWVGFSVPRGSEKNSFTYLGDMVLSKDDSSKESDYKQSLKFADEVFNNTSSALFAPWLKMRQVDKPR